MNKLSMFCITSRNDHLNLIKKIGYLPVRTGEGNHPEGFFRDNTGNNISFKNPNYGEYSFHYWIWKNYLHELKDNWIGFCQYRRFWSFNQNENISKFENFCKVIVKSIPKEYQNYDVILGNPMFINQFRLSKFIKKNLISFLKNPSLLFNEQKRNLKFHFDMMHGHGNIDKAIELLNIDDRNDFKKFLENSVSFNPNNMFICKSSKILNEFYQSIFPWLEKCENEFGFNLEGYGLKRIYGFLAERYMPYWFQKNTKTKSIPIVFKDLSDFI